jgi:UDP-N-acetylmuramate dehydrogenase
MSFLDVLCEIPQTRVKTNECMAPYTTFKIGGPAEIFIQPETTEACVQTVNRCREKKIPFIVLGGCSNILIRDEGIKGAVIHTGLLRGIQVQGNSIMAEAGVPLLDLANAACKAGLTGLEFAAGIPGTVGGGVFMNAGAYGFAMDGAVESVIIWTNEGVREYKAQEMAFAYRYSLLHKNHGVLLSAAFALSPCDPETIQKTMDELLTKRRATQPLDKPSAGSTFKRPPGFFAGKLIADCGLKGLTEGGAEVSEKHAGFIVNAGKATADDVLRLIEKVQEAVQSKFGVQLETEIRII